MPPHSTESQCDRWVRGCPHLTTDDIDRQRLDPTWLLWHPETDNVVKP